MKLEKGKSWRIAGNLGKRELIIMGWEMSVYGKCWENMK